MPVGFIVLAAGAASRYGSCKLAAPISSADATPVLSKLLDVLTTAIPKVPVVVAASEAQPAVIAQLSGYAVSQVILPGQSRGMGSSIASAMPLVDRWQGCFICLGDMPYVQADTYRLLYRYASLSKPAILAPTFAGQRGHPVYFDRSYFRALASLSGAQGAAQLLASNELKLISVNDSGVIRDIDYPSDHLG